MKADMMTYHNPVLLEKSVEGLLIKPGGVYVDATFGGGGHSREILSHLKDGKLIAFDQDEDAEMNVPDDERIEFINANFRYLKRFLKLNSYEEVDGILADLGVSSYQFDNAVKGFSTRTEGPLDMRMSKSIQVSAKDIVNNWELDELKNIFFFYGELKNAYKIASEIVKARKENSIETTTRLVELLKHLAKRGKENKFFAQVFQALRIEVNNELESLKELLIQSLEVLKPGGRLVVISYHSLEDRLVKNFFKSGNFKGVIEKDFYGNDLSPIKPVGKLIVPGEDEIIKNNRARSAKLRIAEKR
ncbi:MAG: 16S rRNA (cytosine(1402)-N(4))-methyltransferase RsmH [Bacteroidales bacterium]